MSQRNVFLSLPEELYSEALAVAGHRHITISDLLIEALSDCIEAQQRRGWPVERIPTVPKGPVRVQ